MNKEYGDLLSDEEFDGLETIFTWEEALLSSGVRKWMNRYKFIFLSALFCIAAGLIFLGILRKRKARR